MDEYLVESGLQKADEKLQADIGDIRAKNTLGEKLAPDQYITTTCEGCGDDLPEARMQYGLDHCVICQGKIEKRRKHFGY